MQLQKKLGFGFILFGIALMLVMYFTVDGGAFLFSSLVGLMAIFFGAFQLMIATEVTTTPPAKNKSKKGRK